MWDQWGKKIPRYDPAMGINCMSFSSVVRSGEEMFCGCGGFRFSIIYGAAVFIKAKRRLVSPMYCKLQRLHWIM